jgi:hypothetical protein
MPSNWKVFEFYPIAFASQMLVRACYGKIYAVETEFLLFSIGWVLVFFTSIWLDRLFGRVSTGETDREKDVIRRFIEGDRAGTRQREL